MAFGDDTPKNACQVNRRKPPMTAGTMGIVGLITILAIIALVAWLGPPLVSLF